MAFTISPQRLRDVRSARKMTQSRLSRKADIARRQIQRIENSEDQNVSVHEKTLTELAKGLIVAPGVLTGDEPLPEGLSVVRRPKPQTPETPGVSRPEEYEARLVKLDDAYAIVEFTKSNSVGNIIARGIPTEAAGRRLTSYHSIRNSLRTGSEMFMEMEVDEDIWTEINMYLDELERELDGPQFSPASNPPANADAPAGDTDSGNAPIGRKVDQ